MQPDQSRPDVATAETVEAGVTLAAERGLAYAAKYLTEHRVPDAVIARVLCEPTLRRARHVIDPD